MAAFGVLDGTPAHAGATYIPPSITTSAPRLASDPRARPLARSAPVAIRIPRIGVNAPVMKLGRDADGTVQVPPLAEHNLTGWYRYGPSPGQRGPAVILGHVDSTTGISVFYYLRNLHAGDTVSLHWDWVCDKLTDRQLRALRTYTMRHLDMVNHRVEHPGPLAVLG